MKFLQMAVILLSSVPIYAGTVVSMSVGKVELLPQGLTGWRAVQSGSAVKNGDTIRTGNSSFAELSSDGTVIRIQPASTVKLGQTLVQDKPQGVLSLFLGSIRCRMQKLKKTGSGYSVTTASSVCAIRGTEFDVCASADGTTILQVTEGAVSFEGLSDSVLVAANQESSAAIGKNPEPVKILKKQDWSRWAETVSSSVKGNEKSILEGCFAKMKKLDDDISQLETELKQAESEAETFRGESKKARAQGKAGDADRLAGEAERKHTISSSKLSMAYYQASRIELVMNVADNAYEAADEKKNVGELYEGIKAIHARHFSRYIKPILDSAAKRQRIMDRKKKAQGDSK